MRLAGGALGVKDLIPVPDLNLRRSTEINAAIGMGHRLVFDEQFDVPEFLVGCRIGTTPSVDQFAVVHRPVLREISTLLREICLLLFPGQGGSAMRIETVPASEISTVENGAKAGRRAWLCGLAAS